MTAESYDPREIPILTDTIEAGAESGADAERAAVLAEALQSAESLLRRAVSEIDPAQLAELIERLRSELPQLLERIMREMSE
jgi:hypothetical protein